MGIYHTIPQYFTTRLQQQLEVPLLGTDLKVQMCTLHLAAAVSAAIIDEIKVQLYSSTEYYSCTSTSV